jgi:hypothetical protein
MKEVEVNTNFCPFNRSLRGQSVKIVHISASQFLMIWCLSTGVNFNYFSSARNKSIKIWFSAHASATVRIHPPAALTGKTILWLQG